MTRALVFALLIVLSAKSVFAAAPARAEKTASDAVEPIDLFNGKNLDGWTTLDGKPVKKGWQVVNGVLHRKSRGGHIVTDKTFRDFDLRFEWKIAKGGNSGVKYRLKKIKGRWLGCEYQLYDDRGRSGSASSTGALYALYPPPKDKPLNPPGKFNNSRIVVRDGHVEHWLNGEKIVEAEIGSDDWNRRVDRSKFNKYPGFAETEQTKIMLQDHGKDVWFRKITIRPFKPTESKPEAKQKQVAIDFNEQIRPILSNACYACHGPDANTREADLRLDSRAEAFADRGGYHAIVPGKPGESEIITRLKSDDEYLKMPPPDAHQQVTDEQIELIERWIESGAEWQEHWSLIPPEAVASPQVKNKSWPRNPIDAFILDRLESEGLAPSKPANKETLLRRVTLDLTGLPPTLEELDAFLADDSPGAYEKVVDRLLASPRYGEHMARYWLDAARYSDSNGYQREGTRTMWPWRDWVVRALNENMSYDQFTIEQLAGDLLPEPTRDQLVATGFHRNHMLNGEGGRIAEESRVEYVVDRVETTGTVWLGLTAGCARCHDHKFDQLTQNEFYGLYAFFNNIDETGRVDRGGNAKPVLPLPTEEQLARRKSLEAEQAQLQTRLESASEEEKKSLKKELEKNKKSLENLKKSYMVTMIMKNREKPRETYRLKRGQWDQPDKSQEILPGVPACFPPLPEAGEGERHNRLDLARWLISPDNPLTARVAVNRDWQHFFGTGLVKTAEDFGTQGERLTIGTERLCIA